MKQILGPSEDHCAAALALFPGGTWHVLRILEERAVFRWFISKMNIMVQSSTCCYGVTKSCTYHLPRFWSSIGGAAVHRRILNTNIRMMVRSLRRVSDSLQYVSPFSSADVFWYGRANPPVDCIRKRRTQPHRSRLRIRFQIK